MSEERNRDRGERSDRGDRGGGRYRRRPRLCGFCVEKVQEINYKDQETLRRYVSEHGRIRPRRQTGTCAKHQRALAKAIKQARHVAYLPFVAD